LAARVYRPANIDGVPAPLVLHLHGGAFTGGDLEGGRCVASLLASAGAVVISLDYPLAPEHPFPQAAEAIHAALGWAHGQRRRLAGAGAALFVAGEEAGGNLAAAAALMARDRQGPALAGQILLSPMLDVCVSTASLRGAQAGPVGCRWADGWRAYLPLACDAMHPYATPGASMRLDGLPPTLLITAQDDPLRDETKAFAKRLRAAGVPVDEAVLALSTGWPRSYLDPAPPRSPWPDAVRERLRGFLLEHAPAAYRGPGLSLTQRSSRRTP
jgi:acetyl esterase/lipase